jgi:hypothetical protein
MKNLIYIFLLTSLNINAQNKWSVGVEYNPGITFRDLNYTEHLDSLLEQSEKKALTSRYATYTSVQLIYKSSKRWSVQSGLNYIVRGKMNPNLASSDLLEDPDGHRINQPLPTKPSKSKLLYAFRFLQLPITTCYNIPFYRKQKIIVSLGMSMDYLLNAYNIIRQKTEGETPQVTKIRIQDSSMHRINYSAYFSVGYQYQLNKKISIKANPYYSINLRYMEKFINFRGRYYNYGLGLGVYYSL